MSSVENVIIVGSGPAGYTAALYTARANLNPLVIEGFMWGGLLQQTTDVENYPGFAEGVMGPQLMQQMRDQAERFGARFITDQATLLDLAERPGGTHQVWVGQQMFRARAVILAMGAENRKLGAAGELEFANRGVSYCATCDASFFRGKQVAVVGGGDSAMEEAIFVSKFAEKVTVIHRRNQFRASKVMLARAQEISNLEFLTPYEVQAFEGTIALERLRLRNFGTGAERELPADGCFVAVGHEPQSNIVRGQVDLHPEGYVLVDGRSTRTSRPGVFAAGDLVDHTYRQAITAAGSGCQAALDAEWYLRDTPQVPTPPPLEGTGSLPEAQWGQAEPEARGEA